MINMNLETEKIQKRYNRIAKFYDLMGSLMDKGNMEKWRQAIWREAKGKVLEVGVGTGKNIEYYSDNIEVTAIDFSENMLGRAKVLAKKLGKEVDLRLMDAQSMEFEDETFDTVITTCVFCSVPDPIKGLQEVKRVCKKDGQIIMLEHVRSKNPLIGAFMDLLNPIVVRLVGANINRNTVENLKISGISVETEQNLMMDIVKHLKCSR